MSNTWLVTVMRVLDSTPYLDARRVKAVAVQSKSPTSAAH